MALQNNQDQNIELPLSVRRDVCNSNPPSPVCTIPPGPPS